MKSALLRYRVMAWIVGVLLIVLICVGVPLKYAAADGTSLQHTGEWITTYLGITHGWLYMGFLICAFLLARLARLPLGFTILVLVLGTVPFASFYGERKTTRYVRTHYGDQLT